MTYEQINRYTGLFSNPATALLVDALVIIAMLVAAAWMAWRAYLLVRYILPSKARWTPFVKAAAGRAGLDRVGM